MTPELVRKWREDPDGTYRRWFLWDERLKNFRSIRRGLAEVVREIEAGTFGTAYKGSSLETVVGSIAEQRQIFKGADHAFLWKPKLRIPDIYENRENQIAFGKFLQACACCNREDDVLAAIRRLDERKIKGLGPAAANILYFLHPTLVPPSNTAIVNGYNTVAGAKVKLGRWEDYLAMREGVLRLNTEHRDLLSNDLGAIAGLLFDVGSGTRYTETAAASDEWEKDLERVRAKAKEEREVDQTHSGVQGWLRDLGRGLGFDVWIATNDRGRDYGGGRLGDGCLAALPPTLDEFIDVIWLQGEKVVAAFEVEHTTSIYSGILRLLDLAQAAPAQAAGLYLVAPDKREEDVRAQLRRPAFAKLSDLKMRYLPYGELDRHREEMARFGEGLKAVEAVAKVLA